nr:ureidoglycolate lyase [Quercus suber]
MERTPRRLVRVSALDPQTFAPFGEVIQNPGTHHGIPSLQQVTANQGSATKWLDVTAMEDFYLRAASSRKAKVVFNMFVSKPRPSSKRANGENIFEVSVLERHPYTPQTFIPLSLDKADRQTCYLIIVAPTLPTAPEDRTLSLRGRVADALSHAFSSPVLPQKSPRSPGPPDLDNIQAFIARGDQCVTYGAGTWHAPMVVLGEREIEFVVVQHANGIADEDCQEVEINSTSHREGIAVLIDEDFMSSTVITKSKL